MESDRALGQLCGFQERHEAGVARRGEARGDGRSGGRTQGQIVQGPGGRPRVVGQCSQGHWRALSSEQKRSWSYRRLPLGATGKQTVEGSREAEREWLGWRWGEWPAWRRRHVPRVLEQEGDE